MGLQIFALVVFLPVAMTYVNYYGEAFSFQCPRGQSISDIFSRHHLRRGDRQYDFRCRPTPNLGHCQMSGNVNNFDEILLYQCPSNGVIAGVSSYHDNKRKDRRFQFYCCLLTQGKKLVSCGFSGYVNHFSDYLYFVVPNGRVLKGTSSYHDNRWEDRRWRFETCRVQ